MSNQHKSPFKFLEAYNKDEKDIFFGRDWETQELHDRVFETNLVLLYGASGTGKTSLINCGFANKFDGSDWLPLFVRRKENLLISLQDVVERAAVRPLPEGNLIKKIRSLYLDYFKPIYFIFDQLEELFILGQADEREAFFKLLRELLSAGLQAKFVLIMREEFIALLHDYENLIPELFDNRQRIERMKYREVASVIKNTAACFGIRVQNPETTISRIIEHLKDQREGIDLANLQVYLDRLYRKDLERKHYEPDKIAFDLELVEQTGQLEDVLADFLDEQIATLERELEEMGAAQKGIPMDVLITLVSERGTRQPADPEAIRTELFRRKKIEPSFTQHCIQRFQEMRLIREVSA